MASSPSTIYVCKSTFTFEEDGVPHVVRGGQTVRAGHPIMKGREDMFARLTVDYEMPRGSGGTR